MKIPYFLLLAAFLLPVMLLAQITQAVIGNLGGEISNNELRLTHNIGDVVGTHLMSNSGPSLSQGFVQCFVCSKNESDTDPTNTSIDLLFHSPHIQVYPNPVRDDLFLEGEQVLLKRVEIISSTGQLILSTRLEHSRLSLAHLPPALYLLRIYGVNDELTYIGKLMKRE